MAKRWTDEECELSSPETRAGTVAAVMGGARFVLLQQGTCWDEICEQRLKS